MPLDTLEAIYRQVLSSKLVKEPIDFLWHAGEPLTMPIKYFDNALATLEKINEEFNRKYNIHIQTNGTLINERWIELFKKYNVNVGVSVDGPKHTHDRFRKTRSNKGTHDATMEGIKKLQKAKMPVHSIMVLTDFSLDYASDIFNFFLDNNIRKVGFNIDEVEGSNKESSYEKTSIARYKKFLRELLDLNKESKIKLSIREINQTIKNIYTLKDKESKDHVLCSTNIPFRILNFDMKGNYSTFCPELLNAKSRKYNDFIMGNVFSVNINNIKENHFFKLVNANIQKGVRLCRESCEYWKMCGGAMPSNKFAEHGDFDVTETMYCKFHKKILVDTVLDYLEEQAPPREKNNMTEKS